MSRWDPKDSTVRCISCQVKRSKDAPKKEKNNNIGQQCCGSGSVYLGQLGSGIGYTDPDPPIKQK
jgi:hypothetical protein